MRNPIHMRAVQRAADIAGGVAPLAMYLKVSPMLITGWMYGTSELPPAVFLRVVEIIIDREGVLLRGAIPPCEAEKLRHGKAANS